MTPNIQEQYIDPQTGRLTIEGYKLFSSLFERLDAMASVTPPTGGATVDAEARSALTAMISAAG